MGPQRPAARSADADLLRNPRRRPVRRAHACPVRLRRQPARDQSDERPHLRPGIRRLLLLLRGAHHPLAHIVILAWFANCVLPAKMGDFYRAYLLRQQTDVSGSKGLGTIFSERALDFLVLMSLLVISGLISFRATVPERFVPAFIVGLLIAAGLIAGLLVVRYSEGRLSRYLPERLRERATRFKHGLLSAFAGRLPLLLGLTVLVWMAESTRLFLVVQALPLHVSLSLAQIMFIALVASLLTTIPALPGGLVLVEGGIIAVLVFFGLTASQALSVAILDRLISYWSLIAVGLVVFLMSHRR
ncbi:MAG: flippase-like domain-containing protein [Chloroflexi bacterium]|nr:MAG: flippase-like domain-containing protein [Chloroflexota bacterium]